MTTETIWHSATQLVTGDPTLTLSYPIAARPAVEISTSDTGQANLKWIYLGIVLPANCAVTAIRICYQLSDSGSFISQIQLQEMQTPEHTLVAHDDTAELRELTPACYISAVHGYRPKGAVTLALRLSFGDTGHSITLGSIGVDLLKCDSHVVNVTCYNAKGDGQIADGSMNLHSHILESPLPVFTLEDERKTIYVAGAGITPAEHPTRLHTRIRSVETKSRVILEHPARFKVTNAEIIWGTDDGAAIHSAIEAATSAGARLYFPARIYMFAARERFPLTGVPYVSAHGARLVGARYSIDTSCVWEGGTVHADHDDAQSWPVFMVQGSQSRLLDVEIFNSAGYTGVEIIGKQTFDVNDNPNGATPVHDVRLDRVAVSGRSAVTIREAQYVSISNSYFSGSDDGIAIKAISANTEHIVITDCMFDGSATMIGIGSEIYEPNAVRNVVVSNCVANNVATPVFIKPALVSGEPIVRGIVENIVISNIAIQDVDGMALTRAVYLLASHSGRIRDVSLSNINCRARFNADVDEGEQEAYCVYVLLRDTSAAVDGLTIRDCVFHDIYDGVPNSRDAPGFPAQTGILITRTPTDPDINNALIEDVTIENVCINGTTGAALSIGKIDRLVIRGIILTNTNTLAAGTRLTIHIEANAVIKNVVIDLPKDRFGMQVDGRLIAEQMMSVFGTYGADVVIPVFVAPCRCLVFRIELVNALPIIGHNTNFSTFTISTFSNVERDIWATAAWDTEGIDLAAMTPYPVYEGEGKVIEAGDVLRLEKADSGTGQFTSEMRVVISFVPVSIWVSVS